MWTFIFLPLLLHLHHYLPLFTWKMIIPVHALLHICVVIQTQQQRSFFFESIATEKLTKAAPRSSISKILWRMILSSHRRIFISWKKSASRRLQQSIAGILFFCILCQASITQKKPHPTKKLTSKKNLSQVKIGASRKKGKPVSPSATVLCHLCKVAMYHCQEIIFTLVNKMTDKKKYTAIEEVFYGAVGKNIIGS
jgi:hypothetical protein